MLLPLLPCRRPSSSCTPSSDDNGRGEPHRVSQAYIDWLVVDSLFLFASPVILLLEKIKSNIVFVRIALFGE